ncbi:enoyl-CoA hydratase/isomerase family protein [Candidatus Hodarchaeum mangrovi]
MIIILNINFSNKTVIIALNNKIPNALNLELLEDLQLKLEQFNKQTEIHSIIITSNNNKFFSIGLDIPSIYDIPKLEFKKFYKTFTQTSVELFRSPKPVIAAISGHAIAGGCILALCCDYRIMADSKALMGLNEIKLGVPVPYLGYFILKELVGYRTARNVCDSGDFFSPEDLFRLGLVDEIVPSSTIMDVALQKAQALGSLPQSTYALIKQLRVQSILEQYFKERNEEIETFTTSWFSSPARNALKEAIKKF